MATVIDSLLIELGLDASKLMTTQKKVVDELKKVAVEAEKTSKATVDSTKKTSVENKKASDQGKKTHDEKKKAEGENKKFGEESTKRAKQNHEDIKKTNEGYEKTKGSLLGLAGAAFAAGALVKTVSDVAHSNAELGRTSILLGMSAKELQTWGGVAKGFGGSSETVQGALQNIAGSIAKFRQGFGGEAVMKGLSFLKLEEKDATDILKVSTALQGFQKIHGIQESKNIAELLGFDEHGYNMLLAGPEKLSELYAEYIRINHISPELTENSRKFDLAIANLVQSFTGLKNETANGALPVMNELIGVMTDITSSFADFDKETDHVSTTIVGLVAGVVALLNAIKALKYIGVPAALKLLTNPYVLGAMSLFYSKGLNKGEDAALIEEQKKAGLVDTRGTASKAEELIGIYQSLGLDREHAAAIVGNAMAESSLDPHAKKGTHKGLLQWDTNRQKNFEKFAGFDLNDARATARKQAEFSIYEMTQGGEQKAGGDFFAAHGVRNLAKIFNDSYERSNGSAEGYRQEMAAGYFGQNNMIGAQANVPANSTTTNSSSAHTTLHGGINIYGSQGNPNDTAAATERALTQIQHINAGLSGGN
jgi:hypothetical protein